MQGMSPNTLINQNNFVLLLQLVGNLHGDKSEIKFRYFGWKNEA